VGCPVLAGCSTAPSPDDLIFKDKAGRVLRKSDLESVSGDSYWQIGSESQEATKLFEMGRAAVQKGDLEAALGFFKKASDLDPSWPYPVYEAAFTYLLRQDFEKAYELYKQVDAMAPRGFFTAKVAVHTLGRELGGELPPGLYLYYVHLKWEKDPKKKYLALTELTEKVPQFAPAWKDKALLESDDTKMLEATEKGLSVDLDPETKGFLLINKALALARAGRKEQAIEILGELALDPSSPLDIEGIAKRAIVFILEGQGN
jgi:tetratricopeptide (TPR) repeat protein